MRDITEREIFFNAFERIGLVVRPCRYYMNGTISYCDDKTTCDFIEVEGINETSVFHFDEAGMLIDAELY